VGLETPLKKAFLGAEGTIDDPRVLLGCNESREGATRADIPLGLGPSCASSCVPNDVAGLFEPIFDGTRLCAKELFGRLSPCNDCGRPAAPVLAENELLDVFLEEEEFDREEKEEESDEFRPGPMLAVVLAV
jgi:hypothetical protein